MTDRFAIGVVGGDLRPAAVERRVRRTVDSSPVPESGPVYGSAGSFTAVAETELRHGPFRLDTVTCRTGSPRRRCPPAPR